MITPKPGSILIGTTQPAELRDDIDAENNEPGRMMLNFHVDDFDAVEAQPRAAGVDLLVPVADRSAGRFGTFAHPDLNYLQIRQFKQDA
jgi:hypothetical protein